MPSYHDGNACRPLVKLSLFACAVAACCSARMDKTDGMVDADWAKGVATLSLPSMMKRCIYKRPSRTREGRDCSTQQKFRRPGAFAFVILFAFCILPTYTFDFTSSARQTDRQTAGAITWVLYCTSKTGKENFQRLAGYSVRTFMDGNRTKPD